MFIWVSVSSVIISVANRKGLQGLWTVGQLAKYLQIGPNHPVKRDLFLPWLVWLGWFARCPIYQKVAGSTPRQGTFLGCGFSSLWGHIYEAAD